MSPESKSYTFCSHFMIFLRPLNPAIQLFCFGPERFKRCYLMSDYVAVFSTKAAQTSTEASTQFSLYILGTGTTKGPFSVIMHANIVIFGTYSSYLPSEPLMIWIAARRRIDRPIEVGRRTNGPVTGAFSPRIRNMWIEALLQTHHF